MSNRYLNKYRKVFRFFELEKLKQPANDNYVQQVPLPLIYHKEHDEKRQ